MRILFVTHGYPPYTRGGAEISTALIAETVSKHHEVMVIAMKYQNKPWKQNGITVYPLLERFDHREMSFRGALNYAWRLLYNQQENARILRDFVRDHAIDIIHIVPASPQYLSLTTAAIRTGKPVVIDVRDYALICPTSYLSRGIADRCPPFHLQCLTRRYRAHGLQRLGTPLFGIYELSLFLWHRHALKCIVRCANARFVTNSSFVLQEMVKAGYPASKMLVINNIARPIQRERKRENRMVYAGQIERYKGVFDAVEAFKHIKDKHMTFELVGVGNDEEALREAIKDEPRIKFRGQISNEEVHHLYGTSRIIIAPSAWEEPFGRFILESMSTGTPLIATQMGGILGAVKSGINGLLVLPNRPDMLTAAIDRLCRDKDLYRRIVSNIKRMQPLYSAPVIARQRLELYDELSKGQ